MSCFIIRPTCCHQRAPSAPCSTPVRYGCASFRHQPLAPFSRQLPVENADAQLSSTLPRVGSALQGAGAKARERRSDARGPCRGAVRSKECAEADAQRSDAVIMRCATQRAFYARYLQNIMLSSSLRLFSLCFRAKMITQMVHTAARRSLRTRSLRCCCRARPQQTADKIYAICRD